MIKIPVLLTQSMNSLIRKRGFCFPNKQRRGEGFCVVPFPFAPNFFFLKSSPNKMLTANESSQRNERSCGAVNEEEKWLLADTSSS